MECIPSGAQSRDGIMPIELFSVDFTETIFHLAEQKIGATIIINTRMNPDSDSILCDIANRGTFLNEPYSPDRLASIFRNKSLPLHNGVVVINLFPQPTIYSAGNKLDMPCQDNWEEVATKSAKEVKNMIDLGIISNESLFGSRQWSAYSVSRHIDAFVVSVFEERSRVSLFKNGEVDIGVTKKRLTETITNAYYREKNSQSRANDSSNGLSTDEVYVQNCRDEMPNDRGLANF